MKIGVFGGSFDPIHLGHLNLVSEIQRIKGLDLVLFCLTGLSPFKLTNKPKASVNDRLEMLRIAIKGMEFAQISDLELESATPSYTVETLKKLKKQYPEDELFFLAGADVLDHFSYWSDPVEIVSLAKPLIGCRESSHLKVNDLDSSYKNAFREGICQTRKINISSTEIREKLSRGEDVSHMLPSEVLDYILCHKLYSKPTK